MLPETNYKAQKHSHQPMCLVCKIQGTSACLCNALGQVHARISVLTMKEQTVARILLAEYWLTSCLDRKFDPAGMNVTLPPFLLVQTSEGSAEDWGQRFSSPLVPGSCLDVPSCGCRASCSRKDPCELLNCSFASNCSHPSPACCTWSTTLYYQ